MNAGELVFKVTIGDQCSSWGGLQQVCLKGRGDGSDDGSDGSPYVGKNTSAREVSSVILSPKKIQGHCRSLLPLQSCEHGVSNRQTRCSWKASLGLSSNSQEDRRRALTDMACENNEAWISNLAFRLLEHVRDSHFEENIAPPSLSSRLQFPTFPASLASERSRLKHYCFSLSLWLADDVLLSSSSESFPSLCVCTATTAIPPSPSPLILSERASPMLSSVPDAHCDSSVVHRAPVSTAVVDILSNFIPGSAWVVSKFTRPASQNTKPALQNTSLPLLQDPSDIPREQTTTSLPSPATRCKSAEQRVKASNKFSSVAWLSPDYHAVRTRSTQEYIPPRSRRSCLSSASAQKITRARTRCWSKHFLTSAVLMLAVLAAATTAYELKREYKFSSFRCWM